MKGLAILGSTGVIGRLALEVVRDYPKDFKVISLACKNSSDKFSQQIKEFKPKVAVMTERDGEKAMIEAVEHEEVDLVVVAVVGMSGLKPTLAAIKVGKDIALANKEALVVAGELVMKEVKKYGVSLVPLDSEHSAIWQSLKSGENKEIEKVILTMGKGKLSTMNEEKLSKVKLEDALRRKTWVMGKKIGVDSATCMNKAFEVVEAGWLFNLKPEQIEVVVHPEYICHSLVEFKDGSFLTELGVADMKRYVQYGMFYPERREVKKIEKLNLVGKNLSFEKAPVDKFLGLKLGHKALEFGGTMPAVMHGADRAAVEAFSKENLGFLEIPKVIEKVMRKHKAIKNPNLEQIMEAEVWGNEEAERDIQRRKK